MVQRSSLPLKTETAFEIEAKNPNFLQINVQQTSPIPQAPLPNPQILSKIITIKIIINLSSEEEKS